MKTLVETICLLGVMILKLMLCSADDGLTEDKLKEIYKLSTAKDAIAIDAKNYKIYKGETKKPTKKIWMKSEISGNSSYVSHEIGVFGDLKKEKKDLLKECVADMLNHGTYEGKKVIVFPRLGKNLKEYSSKPYPWDDLSKMGPCMIKSLKLLHKSNYVHRNLKPEVFAFGTEKEVAPLKNQVYLFDVGLAEKYRHSNGSHKALAKVGDLVVEMAFATREAMNRMTQNRRDDIESLFYVLAYLAGLTPLFQEKQPKKVFEAKHKFCTNLAYIKSLFEESNKTSDVRVYLAFLDYAQDLSELFKSNNDYEKEPEYDNFIQCFDQGLSAKEIEANYAFIGLDKFEAKSGFSLIGRGNATTDPKNKVEVVMKLMRTNPTPGLEFTNIFSFKTEIRAYKDLKKGLKHSLLRENICGMLDYGIYDNRRAIIMPPLGLNWLQHVQKDYPNGYPYDLFCKAAKNAIGALRFVHERGYVHQDIKADNFAIGTAEFNKSDKSKADAPLKSRMYLFDFGLATKWRYANKTHKPRVKVNSYIGTTHYLCRTSILKYTQSRRDDMESLMFTFVVGATARYFFKETQQEAMWKERNNFITDGRTMASIFKLLKTDERIHEAMEKYATELNKLFASDKPEYYEKEPDYNAFCACFGGTPGNKACVVE